MLRVLNFISTSLVGCETCGRSESSEIMLVARRVKGDAPRTQCGRRGDVAEIL